MAFQFSDNAFTLEQVLYMTLNTEIGKRRMEYRDRDVLKSTVKVQEVTSISKDRPNQITKKLRIESYSYPQYEPYLSVKSRRAKTQRKIKHRYDIVLEFEDSVMTSRFKWRVGSQRKWVTRKAPQKKVKTIYPETMERWKKRYKDPKKLKKVIAEHIKKAEYLNQGDWISRKFGLNGDFYFRLQPLLAERDMLYGKVWETNLPKNKYIFFDKHTYNLILYLLKRRVLKMR